MILEIFIENFRSLKNRAEFSLLAESTTKKERNVANLVLSDDKNIRVLKAGAIYGHNASGKTNIIRSCFTVFKFITNTRVTVDDRIPCYQPFIFDNKSKELPSTFEIKFIGPNNIRYCYYIKFTATEILTEQLDYYPNNRQANIFKRLSSNSEDGIIHIAELGSTWNSENIKLFRNQSMIAKCGSDYPHAEISAIFSYFNSIYIINALNNQHTQGVEKNTTTNILENSSTYNKLNKLVKYCDVAIQGFNVTGVEKDSAKNEEEKNSSKIFGIHAVYNDKREFLHLTGLPLSDESNGTRTVYGLGGSIINALEKGGILIVDELETSLHPLVTRIFLELFQNPKTNPLNAQIIFTTHESTIMNRELLRRDQIWFTEKNMHGETELFSLQDFEDVREETPFDRWYLMGKIGAIPHLADLDTIFDA